MPCQWQNKTQKNSDALASEFFVAYLIVGTVVLLYIVMNLSA